MNLPPFWSIWPSGRVLQDVSWSFRSSASMIRIVFSSALLDWPNQVNVHSRSASALTVLSITAETTRSRPRTAVTENPYFRPGSQPVDPHVGPGAAVTDCRTPVCRS